MGSRGAIVIHANPGLKHQRRFAAALRAGFHRHGEKAEITYSRTCEADMHVVLGPWYAKSHYADHPQTLYLDRCHYGNPEDVVSMGWMSAGRMLPRVVTTARYEIPYRPWKMGHIESLLILGDYGDERETIDGYRCRFRPHPAQKTPEDTLNEVLKMTDCAVGKSSSALITAALEGVPIVCRDPWYIAYLVSGTLERPYRGDRQDWVALLSWMNWSHDEIRNGEAWEHLKCH